MKYTIECPICHKSFKQLHSHIRKHMSLDEFKEKYPDMLLISENQSEIIRKRMLDGQGRAMSKQAKGVDKPNLSIAMKGNRRGVGTNRSAEIARYRNQALKQHEIGNFGVWDDDRRKKQSQITKDRWASGSLRHVWHPKWQSDLESFLNNNAICYEVEYRLPVLVNGKKLYKPFDFYIKEANLLIELQGCFWHGCSECYEFHPLQTRVKENDKEKKVFALAAGYNLLCIWEHEKQQMFEIVNERIKTCITLKDSGFLTS